jgi:hypothetical protein
MRAERAIIASQRTPFGALRLLRAGYFPPQHAKTGRVGGPGSRGSPRSFTAQKRLFRMTMKLSHYSSLVLIQFAGKSCYAAAQRDTPMESSNGIREYVDEAIRFWEPRRIAYNLVLTVVTAGWFLLGWSHFRAAFHLEFFLYLLILAVAANICYCAAYLVDIPLQYSSFRPVWRRRRWWLWLAGVLLGVLLASYWINDEIYPGVGSSNPSVLNPNASVLSMKA